jgi:hypothetical protein
MRIVNASGLWRWKMQRVLLPRRLLTEYTVGVFMIIVTIVDGFNIAGRRALIRSLPSRAETSRVRIRHRFGGKGSGGGRMKLFPAVETSRAHNLLKLLHYTLHGRSMLIMSFMLGEAGISCLEMPEETMNLNNIFSTLC